MKVRAAILAVSERTDPDEIKKLVDLGLSFGMEVTTFEDPWTMSKHVRWVDRGMTSNLPIVPEGATIPQFHSLEDLANHGMK